jgi:hypothetical protein
LAVAFRSAAGTVAAALTRWADAATGHEKWTADFITEKDIGEAWAARHPAEAAAYNAGQMTRAQAAQAVAQEPWRVDLDQFDQTFGVGLDRLFEEEAERQAAARKGEPARTPVDGAATREAEKRWR